MNISVADINARTQQIFAIIKICTYSINNYKILNRTIIKSYFFRQLKCTKKLF